MITIDHLFADAEKSLERIRGILAALKSGRTTIQVDRRDAVPQLIEHNERLIAEYEEVLRTLKAAREDLK